MGRHYSQKFTYVDNSSNTAEQDNLTDRNRPKCLGEISGISHFSDEAGEGNLSNKGIADVQESAHSCHKSRASRWKSKYRWLSTVKASQWNDRVGIRIVLIGMIFDPGEDGCQQNGDECEECRTSSQL